jgi:hypothetical protein
MISFNGKTMCIKDWCSSKGLGRNGLRNRLVRGWSMELAMTFPVQQKKIKN